ncbi:MAG: hypothetical protein WC375_08880 [Methanomassiliicoccales archaeon]|jgi:predicted transcriptional regulator
MKDWGNRGGPWSDEFMVMYLLYQLHIRRSFGESECTVHQLSTLENVPVQRDQRIKRLLQILSNRGYVAVSEKDGFAKYSITPEGIEWWNKHQDVLAMFWGIR